MSRPPREPDAPLAGIPPRVTIARILRPRGRVGEVAAQLFTDFPERLASLHEVLLARNSADPSPLKMPVKRCWLHKGQAIFHFAGVDSINAAEKLRGLEVQIPFEQRVELPAGKYFVSDLIGCEVYCLNEMQDGRDTTLLGVVHNVALDTGTPLLVMDSPRGEVLIPLAEDICTRIDVRARRIEIVPPDGLLDINS